MLTFLIKAALVLALLSGSAEAGKGNGGRGKGEKDVVSLEIIEACGSELSQCSFNFEMGKLARALKKYEAAVEEAEEDGTRPPKLSKKVQKKLKKVAKCLREVSADLDMEGKCAAALHEEHGEHSCSPLVIMESCMEEIEFDCSVDFDFELTALMDTLSAFEATMEEALEGGTRPPKLPRKVKKAMEHVRECLGDIGDELDEDSECVAALEGEACSEEWDEDEKPEEDEDEKPEEDEDEKPEEDEDEKPEEDEDEKPEEDEDEKPEDDEDEEPEELEMSDVDPKSIFKTRAGAVFG